MIGRFIFGRIIDDFLDGICDACEEFNDNFDMTEIVYNKIREENEKRKKCKFSFSDELTKKDFEEIVIDICEKIRRITQYSIDCERVYITVISNSRLSEWDCELDFNDYGSLTGRCWIDSENDDSEIPEIVARRISERISLVLDSNYSDDNNDEDEEIEDEYEYEEDDECDDDEFDELWNKGINMDIGPQPIEFDDFFNIVAEALIEVENKRIGYFSLGYTPKRNDNISCIQSCLDDTRKSFCVEIVVNSNDNQFYRIFRKNGYKRREVLDIFYNVCVNFEMPLLDEWDVVKDTAK